MKLMAIRISKTHLVHKYQKTQETKQDFQPLKRDPTLGGGCQPNNYPTVVHVPYFANGKKKATTHVWHIV